MQRARRTQPAKVEAKASTKASDSLYGKIEQAMAAGRLKAEEAFTLLKIAQSLRANPDGAFAELLVGMLQGAAESVEVEAQAAAGEEL